MRSHSYLLDGTALRLSPPVFLVSITSGYIEYGAVLCDGESLDEHFGRRELAIYQMVRDR
ncbi:MAG: hypothetical protein L0220_35415 [Acidobacteria bacterium]|nr:hypothetical protein [Acidobacteriota bacterium]